MSEDRNDPWADGPLLWYATDPRTHDEDWHLGPYDTYSEALKAGEEYYATGNDEPAVFQVGGFRKPKVRVSRNLDADCARSWLEGLGDSDESMIVGDIDTTVFDVQEFDYKALSAILTEAIDRWQLATGTPPEGFFFVEDNTRVYEVEIRGKTRTEQARWRKLGTQYGAWLDWEELQAQAAELQHIEAPLVGS